MLSLIKQNKMTRQGLMRGAAVLSVQMWKVFLCHFWGNRPGVLTMHSTQLSDRVKGRENLLFRVFADQLLLIWPPY